MVLAKFINHTENIQNEGTYILYRLLGGGDQMIKTYPTTQFGKEVKKRYPLRISRIFYEGQGPLQTHNVESVRLLA